MKKRQKTKNKRGFLLSEVVVYLFVMSLLLVTILGSAAAYLRSRQGLNRYQQRVEELSLFVNEIAKKVRMSNCGDDGSGCTFDGGTLGVTDNISDNPWEIKFVSGERIEDKVGHVLLENVTGEFVYKNESGGGIPLVTIKIQDVDQPQILIETSVSQRSGYSPN